MKHFIKLVCLYLGLVAVFLLQAHDPSDMNGPAKVEYEYSQF